jgi:uncharacterized protein (TIGR02246 family)
MCNRISLGLAATLALALFSLDCTTPKAGMTADLAAREAPAIAKLWDTYMEGVNTGNHELWLSNWDEDGVKMNPDAPAIVGKETIKARTATVFANTTRSMVITVDETQFTGGYAYCRGSFTSTTTPKAGGAAVLFDGKFLTILKKQPDGSWKIYRDIFNSNVPPK